MAKKTKTEADYSTAKPDGDQCRMCKWFTQPHECEIVGGRIEPDGWCKFWHGSRSKMETVRRRQEESSRLLKYAKEYGTN